MKIWTKEQNQFSDIVQSNEDIEINDGSFTIKAYDVRLPSGTGFRENYLLRSFAQKMDNILKNTLSLINIPKTVHPYCAAAALLVGQEYERTHSSRMFSCRRVN